MVGGFTPQSPVELAFAGAGGATVYPVLRDQAGELRLASTTIGERHPTRRKARARAALFSLNRLPLSVLLNPSSPLPKAGKDPRENFSQR